MKCTRKFNVLCIFGLINTHLTQNEAIYDAHSAPEDLPHSRTAQLRPAIFIRTLQLDPQKS